MWQYKQLHNSGHLIPDEELDAMGADGWELLTVTPLMVYIFKRLKPTETPTTKRQAQTKRQAEEKPKRTTRKRKAKAKDNG